MRRTRDKLGWIVVACALAFFGWRLFVPPPIGIADNGDFPKIAGPFWLGPVGGRAVAADHAYFPQHYVRSTDFMWYSHVYSSEDVFAWCAWHVSRLFQRNGNFDIRWMGAAHLAVLLWALAWLMRALMPLGTGTRAAVGAAAILTFGDAAYLAYCNTFFMDAAAFAGVLLMAVAAVDIAVRGSAVWRIAGYTAGALLYVTSKMQHAPMAIACALLLLALVRSRAAMAAAIVLILAAAGMTHSAPSSWRGEALFDVVFFEITPHSPTPLADLKEMGLGEAELPYVGLHVFSPGAPTADLQWSARFTERLPYWRVALFYAAHPLRTAGLLWTNLKRFAWQIQEPEMGNYPPGSGRPPGAQAAGYWSGPRGALLWWMPWTAPLWIAMVLVFAFVRRSPLAWVCAALALMAAGEFVIAALTDAVETNRHLFLFHVLTEMTICAAVGWAAGKAWPLKKQARRSRPEESASRRV